MLKRCCSGPGAMAAADQQVSAAFASLNLFRTLIRPSGRQRGRFERQLSASLAGVLGWGSMPCTISIGQKITETRPSATLRAVDEIIYPTWV
jgi:hypothetical protein